MIICPANDFTCPYFKDGHCTMSNKPIEVWCECDDFAALVGDWKLPKDLDDWKEEV